MARRIERAQARGELRTDADPQTVIEMLFGATYFRLLVNTGPEPRRIDAARDITFRGLR